MRRKTRDDELREVTHVKQVPGEDRRRWFSSSAMDLVVWYGGDGAISAFQLCYDKPNRERALTWKAGDTGITHATVDDGEAFPLGHKSTPILLPDGAWDAADVLARFTAAARALPPEVAHFVEDQLA